MDISQIRESIKGCSSETERIFTRMGNCFPTLLSITSATNATVSKSSTADSSSLQLLSSVFKNLSDGLANYNPEEVGFFEKYNNKNTQLFSSLNEKMVALDRVNERVSAIRLDSEELEIISLNAMVISIKSGEKGRAFSCITENLRRLSATMISLSNALIIDEKKLIEKNDELKVSFADVVELQKKVLESHISEENFRILPILAEASKSLDLIGLQAKDVFAPIQEAMSGIQLQDIIRQSIDQIILALAEVNPLKTPGTLEEKLDQVILDIELIDICHKITSDITKDLDNSIRSFSDNWKKVHEILDAVEKTRLVFISAYLDSMNRSSKSLPAILEQMAVGFTEYISNINQYQRGQRSMIRDSVNIVSEVKHLRNLFDTIRPIISRLQHVRITQQIEVAKNPAIAAVKDTVENMSVLIMQADERVKVTRTDLESFIKDIEVLTGNFSAGAEKDNRELERIKDEKLQFFNLMKSYKDELVLAMAHLRVYPESFATMCVEIDQLLENLKSVNIVMSTISSSFEDNLKVLRKERDGLLATAKLNEWNLHNDRFRELVERFTITSHKHAAGMIGGFEVETGGLNAIESGDVTLFF